MVRAGTRRRRRHTVARSGQAGGEEADHDDEQQSLGVGPGRGEVLRQRRLGPRDSDRAEDRSEQGAAASDRDADEEGDGRNDADVGGGDDADDRNEHRSGDAGEERGDGVGDHLDVGGVVAEEPDAFLLVAHRDEQFTVAGLHQLPGCGDDEQQDGRHDEEQHPLVDGIGQLEAEEGAEAVEAVGAAGGLLTDEQDREGGGECLGQDREVGALHTSLEHTESRAVPRRAPGR